MLSTEPSSQARNSFVIMKLRVLKQQLLKVATLSFGTTTQCAVPAGCTVAAIARPRALGIPGVSAYAPLTFP